MNLLPVNLDNLYKAWQIFKDPLVPLEIDKPTLREDVRIATIAKRLLQVIGVVMALGLIYSLSVKSIPGAVLCGLGCVIALIAICRFSQFRTAALEALGETQPGKSYPVHLVTRPSCQDKQKKWQDQLSQWGISVVELAGNDPVKYPLFYFWEDDDERVDMASVLKSARDMSDATGGNYVWVFLTKHLAAFDFDMKDFERKTNVKSLVWEINQWGYLCNPTLCADQIREASKRY